MASRSIIMDKSTRMENERDSVASASRTGKYKKAFSRIAIFTDLPVSYMRKGTIMRVNSRTIVETVKVATCLPVVLIMRVNLLMTSITAWDER